MRQTTVFVVLCALLLVTLATSVCQAFVVGAHDDEIYGYHFHIYYYPNDNATSAHAKKLYTEAYDRWGHELSIANFDRPVGPHVLPMFQIELLTAEKGTKYVGQVLAWIMEKHGELPVLIHGLGGDELLAHTDRAAWIGQRLVLNTRRL